MTQILITSFKVRYSQLQVRKTKEPICITRHGKQWWKSFRPPSQRTTLLGLALMKNSIKIIGDIVSPASDADDWEVLRDPDRVAGPRGQTRKR